MYSQNWVISGLFSPRSTRSAAITLGLALCPARSRAGSAVGRIRNSTNVSAETITSKSTPHRMRLST